MVVIEALKGRLNRGEEPDIWFYRNSSGSIEVDLLFESAGRVYPREIKCSATYSADMGKGLKDFALLETRSQDPLVIYSGVTAPGQAVNFAEGDKWAI